jgi:hypothetical protein
LSFHSRATASGALDVSHRRKPISVLVSDEGLLHKAQQAPDISAFEENLGCALRNFETCHALVGEETRHKNKGWDKEAAAANYNGCEHLHETFLCAP